MVQHSTPGLFQALNKHYTLDCVMRTNIIVPAETTEPTLGLFIAIINFTSSLIPNFIPQKEKHGVGKIFLP